MRLLALDFETYFDTNLSLKKLNIMEYVNNPDFSVHGVAARWVHEEDTATWFADPEELFADIDWSDTAILCHHTDFDAYILSQVYDIRPAFHYDTMAMSRGRWPAKKASLEALVERLFPDKAELRKGKELASFKGIKTADLTLDQHDILGGYACNDVDIMVAAYLDMLPTYPKRELQVIDIVVKMFTQPRFVLDRELTTATRNKARDNSADKVTAAGVPKEVLSSNDKFAAYMKDVLGIEPPMKQGKKKLIPALGKNDIAFQKLRAAHPEHKAIWDARTASKSRIDETRSTRFLNGTNRDGTISMPLKYYAAHTGRFGGGEKMNPQNLKRGSDLRKALKAPEGYVVIVVDKSQIEARLTAWLAGCKKLLDAFRNKRDVYSEFASTIYNRLITKADAIQRFVGKTCILGLGFGVGGVKLQVTLESGSQGPVVVITEQESRRIVSTYRLEYPEIPSLWKKLESVFMWIQNPGFFGQKYGPVTATKDGFILPNGMQMQYPEAEGLSFMDSRYNMRKTLWGGVLTENLIQALARVDIADNMCDLDDWFAQNPALGGNVALQIHDEIICIAKKEHAQTVYDKMIQLMTTPPAWAPDLPLAAEGGWAEEYSK
jgi:DNA polymerase